MNKLHLSSEELDAYFVNLISMMQTHATDAYNSFVLGYESLNKDVSKSERKFLQIHRLLSQYFNDSFSFNLELCPKKYLNDYYLLYAQIFSLASKASHNLKVIARSKHDKIKEKEYGEYELFADANIYMIYYLSLEYIDKETSKTIEALFNNINKEYLVNPIGELLLISTYILINDFGAYLTSDHFVDTEKHWYSAYEMMKNLNNLILNERCKVVALYLANHIKELEIEKLIYHSIFFESILLDYLYQNNDLYGVDFVINIGYDYYLELDTLMIIARNDKMYLREQMKKLKVICLERLIEKLNPNDEPAFLKDLYNREDKEEIYRLALEALSSIDETDLTDPRNHKDRKTPYWFKSN